MSDTLPFPAGESTEDDARPASRRPVLLVAGGLGVAALAVLGVLALSGPGDEELGLGLPAGAPAAAATPQASASPSPSAPATTEVRRGRDPFRGPAAVSTGSAGTSDPGTPGAGVAPAPALPVPGAAVPQPPQPDAVAPAPVGPPAAGAEPDGAPDGAPDGGLSQVRLVRVTADQTAVLTVDGTSQTVRVGDGFGPAGSLLLLSLQEGPDDGQWTAVVQRGSGDPFDVVSGSPATVA